MANPSDVTLQDMIDCVTREIGFRRRVYPRWVAAGKLAREKADLEIKRMEAVRTHLMGQLQAAAFQLGA